MTIKCKKQVTNWTGFGLMQCSRKATKDGYCFQHHPDEVKKRREKAETAYKAKQERLPWRRLEKAQEEIKSLRNQLRQEQAKTDFDLMEIKISTVKQAIRALDEIIVFASENAVHGYGDIECNFASKARKDLQDAIDKHSQNL